MSFLEKESEPSSALWDWVIGIGLVLLIGAGTWYYQHLKKSSNSRFAEAESLFHAGDFQLAADMYEELKQAQYATPAQDSLLYERLDSIAVLRDQDAAELSRVQSLLAEGDTVTARKIRDKIAGRGLLPEPDIQHLRSF